MRDKLFNSNSDISDFRFDESVVAVFDDMVKRSVPGYEAMIQMVGLVARTYGRDHTNYYDLGSSTGATTLALAASSTWIYSLKDSELPEYLTTPDSIYFLMILYSPFEALDLGPYKEP